MKKYMPIHIESSTLAPFTLSTRLHNLFYTSLNLLPKCVVHAKRRLLIEEKRRLLNNKICERASNMGSNLCQPCTRQNESAGKRKSTKIKKGNKYLSSV